MKVHINSHQRAKQTILQLEDNFPVDQWRINGIDVWPYIRIKLYYALLNPNTPQAPTHHNTKVSESKNSKLRRLIALCLSVIKLNLFFLRLKSKKILFFGAHFHRVNLDGVNFNRFYDSMVKHHGLEDDVYMVEYLKVNKNTFNKSAVIELSKLLGYYKLVRKLNLRKKRTVKVALKDYQLFCEHLKKESLNEIQLGVSENQLVTWVRKIEMITPFFKKLLEKVKPSKVCFLGYYGYDNLYAALYSANLLKITTIDFQHGPQTNVHMAFSNWSKVPKGGFNLMPKVFWNWDKASKKNIDLWAKRINGVSAKVAGQPYVTFNELNYPSDNLSNSKNTILYSMQTSPLELFTPGLINLIKSTELNWVLRLHPRNDESLEKINEFLKKHNIDKKCIVQNAFDSSLTQALKNARVHITNYSGCTLEAIMLSVPTVLVHDVGKEMFENYIDNVLVYYLSQSDSKFGPKFIGLVQNITNSENSSLNNSRIFNPIKEKFN